MFRLPIQRGLASSRVLARTIVKQASRPAARSMASVGLRTFMFESMSARPALTAAAVAAPICAAGLMVTRPFNASATNYAKKDSKGKKKGGKKGGMPSEYAEGMQAMEDGDLAEALDKFQSALEKVVEKGPTHPYVVQVTEQLGHLYYMGGEYEGAAFMLERRLFGLSFENEEVMGLPEGWKEKVPLDDEHVASLLDELAESYAHIDATHDALEIMEHLRDDFKSKGKLAEQVQCELTMGNILYSDADEDPAKRTQAMQHFERVVEDNKKVYDEDPEFAAEIDFQFASAVADEEPDKAKAAYERALETFNKLIEEHQSKLDTMERAVNTGDEAAAQDAFEAADEEAEDVTTLQEHKFYGLMGIGECCASENASKRDFDMAKTHFEDALKVARDLDGPEANTLAAWSLHRIAILYDEFEKSSIYAEGFFNSAVAEYEHPDIMQAMKNAGENVEEYIDTLEDFATFYRKHGRKADAESLEKKIEKAREMLPAEEEDFRDDE